MADKNEGRGHKLDESVDAFRIDGETKAKLQALGAAIGMTLTDYIRLQLHAAAWGEEEVINAEVDRLRRGMGRVR